MRITSVTVRKLHSGPGFTNHAIEASADVADGDVPEEILATLTDWVENMLGAEAAVVALRDRRNALNSEVSILEGQKERLRKEIVNLKRRIDVDVEIPF